MPRVALIDNPSLVQYFGKHVLAGPEEELLESFYFNLGAQWITSMVKAESIVSQPLASGSPEAQALRSHVLERLTIFLAEARRKQTEYTVESLKQDGKFIVTEVRDLQVKYTLRSSGKEFSHFEVSFPTLYEPVTLLSERLDLVRYGQQEWQQGCHFDGICHC